MKGNISTYSILWKRINKPCTALQWLHDCSLQSPVSYPPYPSFLPPPPLLLFSAVWLVQNFCPWTPQLIDKTYKTARDLLRYCAMIGWDHDVADSGIYMASIYYMYWCQQESVPIHERFSWSLWEYIILNLTLLSIPKSKVITSVKDIKRKQYQTSKNDIIFLNFLFFYLL